MDLVLGELDGVAVDALDVEIVERKGLGHPDTLCDMLAEQFSLSLCRFYLERAGVVLHHNVDKVLLCAGSAHPRFGGGEVVEPIEIFVAGRATDEFQGVKVPLADLLVESSERWLGEHLHALDPARHVRFHALVRPGSADLVELYLRGQRSGVRLSNDTSMGVGYAPLSELETIVYEAERRLNAPDVKAARPETGEDVKVMGVRCGDRIRLTVGCAFVSRHVIDIDDYLRKKAQAAEIVRETAAAFTNRAIAVDVNAADDPGTGSIFLTVTGTSAEAGDDGEAGRGNRTNGLITPYRPMTMESVAGKNPLTHVGKVYNLVADLVASALVEEIGEVREAQCRLVSQIGRPIQDPQVVDVKVRLDGAASLRAIEAQVRGIVDAHLGRMVGLWEELVDERLGFDVRRPPTRRPGAVPR
jgi:S-adenosylmethionine synthetase